MFVFFMAVRGPLLAICTSSAFAGICARNAQLETLAIAFQTSRLLASTAFSVQHPLSKGVLSDLSLEGVRVSFEDFILSLLDHIRCIFGVAAASAATVNSANHAICKAFAVKL